MLFTKISKEDSSVHPSVKGLIYINPLTAELIFRNAGVDLLRPGVDTAGHVADVGETVLAEMLSRDIAAVAVVAKEGQRGVFWHCFDFMTGKITIFKL